MQFVWSITSMLPGTVSSIVTSWVWSHPFRKSRTGDYSRMISEKWIRNVRSYLENILYLLEDYVKVCLSFRCFNILSWNEFSLFWIITSVWSDNSLNLLSSLQNNMTMTYLEGENKWKKKNNAEGFLKIRS